MEAVSSSYKPFISNLHFFLTKLKSHQPLQTKFLLWVTHSHLFNSFFTSTPTPQPCHLLLTSLMSSRKAMEILTCRITYKLFPVWFPETLWAYQNINFDGILWITESPIASLVWTSLWLKKKNDSNVSSFGGMEITKEKWYYFPTPRKFISKHIKMHLSSHHTELFWKRPCFEKNCKAIFRLVAWLNEAAGWQMSYYSLRCINIYRTAVYYVPNPSWGTLITI